MPPPAELPEPQDQRQRSGRREPSFLRSDEWAGAGAFLKQAFDDSKLSKRKLLALIRYEGGTNRLNAWFRGDQQPTPETLARLCPPLNLSYLEVIDRFGYYRELLRIFDDLVQLGDRWRNEDGAFGTLVRLGPDPKAIRDSGVTRWRGRVITWGKSVIGFEPLDPREDPAFNKRYTVGEWHEAMPQMARNTPEIVRDAVRNTRSTVTVVPKPTAVAILLAVLAFERRGDRFKRGSLEYRFKLAKAADALVTETQQSRPRGAGRPRNIHPLLQRAMDTLDESTIPFNSRRIIAAEYIISWAESVCEPYARFARLAAFDIWGDAGGIPRAPDRGALQAVPGATTSIQVAFPSVYTQMPQHYDSTLPEIEELTTDK